MAIDKSTWNKKQKVSQSTINEIKSMGMTKALKMAKMNAGAYQGGLVAEYQEGTRRLYGDKRFYAATAAKPPKAKTSYSPAPYKSPSQKAASTKYSPTPYKSAAAKKSDRGPKSGNLKAVAGTAAAVALLLAGRGKGAGLATKLAPGLMKNKVAQALLTGEIKKAAPKVVSKAATKASTASVKVKDTVAAASGRAAAKAGKPVSQSQYDAMLAAAKARGISTTAKKATTTAAKKTAAKKVVKKAAAPAASKAKTAAKKLSAGKRWDANAPK